jgi:hypothetical protein
MKQTLLFTTALALGSITVQAQVLMIDFGSGTAYNGINSPAHATGSIPSSNTSWDKLNRDNATSPTWYTTISSSLGTGGTLRYSTARGNTEAASDGGTAQFSTTNDVAAASSTPSSGIWGTTLTSSYIVDITSANRRDPVAVAIGNILPGEYHVYLVAHHAGNLNVPLNVGYSLQAGSPATTLNFGTSMGSTATLTPSLNTDVWVAGEDYIRWTVTVTDVNETLVVMVNNANNTGTGLANQATISSLQIVAVPEPSTYAALLGLLVLGFVVYRRRKS